MFMADENGKISEGSEAEINGRMVIRSSGIL